MIKSFRHKGLERFFKAGSKRGIKPAHASRLSRQLQALDSAVSAEDMDHPGWRLHPLTGSLAGHWSIDVSGNWRLTFAFEDDDVVLVDYQDYHWRAWSKRAMSEMFNPPHPGAILREDVLPGLGISVKDAATQLAVSRATLSRVINEHAAISAEMALKLEDWYDRLGYKGGRAEHWLKMQLSYDLWRARQRHVAAGRAAWRPHGNKGKNIRDTL
jgi:proteic killer suppression protein